MSIKTTFDFTDRIVLITGAGRGQGAREAESFAGAGAHVVVADIDETAAADVVSSIAGSGGSATAVRLDVAAEQDWHDLHTLLTKEHGRLDVLVNNAAIPLRKTLTQTSVAEWDRVMVVNLRGAFLGLTTMVPLLRAGTDPSVVNIGSTAGLAGNISAAYSTSKWALRGLTKSAAVELAPQIRVNAVHPGIVLTEFSTGNPEFVASMTAGTAMGRAATPDDVTRTVLYLASELAAFVTGQDIAVDGGFVDLAAYLPVARDIGLI